MFDDETSPEKSENRNSECDEGEAGEAELGYYGESFELEDIKDDTEFFGETEEKEWVSAGEYSESEQYFLYNQSGEAAEYISIWEGKEGSLASEAALSEIEETEEEKQKRREREELIELIRQKMFDRLLIRRKNAFLQKKLTEHFKKRKIESAFKVESKTPELEKKYLNRLYAFQELKKSQENEVQELNSLMESYQNEAIILEKELEEKLKHFITRAKEVSLRLILVRSGKKLNEKVVDTLLRRQVKKNEEKGREKLRYIQIKNLIEEKQGQIKAIEYFKNGLHLAEYEQLEVDNQNYILKIDKKDDKLISLRLQTQDIIQNLAHMRQKSYALEGDIELMKEKVYDVEKNFYETRKRLKKKRIKRDVTREQYARLKTTSGLLTKNDLLMDFERSIYETKVLSQKLKKMKKLMQEFSKSKFM